MDWEIKSVHGHYVGYINGEFFCSGDTYLEVARELEKILNS